MHSWSHKPAIDYIQEHMQPRASIAMVLGSGLGSFVQALSGVQTLAYRDIPSWPHSTVPGHAGKLVHGTAFGVPLLVLQGRSHYYENLDIQAVVRPIHILKGLGIHTLILTTAAGSLNSAYSEGSFMLMSDHINLLPNPLLGTTQFLDLTDCYCPNLRQKALQAAKEAHIPHHTGVHCAVTGPSYETPAEALALSRLGADTVSMSTTPEAIIAHSLGLRTLGIACITNQTSKGRTSHTSVLESAQSLSALYPIWMERLLPKLAS